MIELPDFLRPLEKVSRPFPIGPVREALARREESTPHLLHVLEWVSTHPEDVPDDYLIYEYAMRIFAVIRDTRAHTPILRLARHPMPDDLLGDTISGDLGQIMASTSGGDTEGIRALIEDTTVDVFIRAAGLRALGVLHRAGQLPRSAFSDYLGGLFALGGDGGEEFFGTALVDICAQFGLSEHLEKVRAAWDDGLVDPMFDDWRNIEKRLKSGTFDESEASYWQLIDDPAEEMSGWYCFTAQAARDELRALEADAADEPVAEARGVSRPTIAEPAPCKIYEPPKPHMAESKPGRNDPCPCGSGKKYKKCCG